MTRIILALAALLPFSAFAQPTNEKLIRQVRHELVMLPFYDVFDNLAYRVDGDKVTLFGQVVRPTLKTDAERVVKRLEGVSAVQNEIEVLPVSPNDDRLRMRLYRAIYSKAPLQRYSLRAVPPIHIIVKNGNVTLEGVVARQMDRDVAAIVHMRDVQIRHGGHRRQHMVGDGAGDGRHGRDEIHPIGPDRGGHAACDGAREVGRQVAHRAAQHRQFRDQAGEQALEGGLRGAEGVACAGALGADDEVDRAVLQVQAAVGQRQAVGHGLPGCQGSIRAEAA